MDETRGGREGVDAAIGRGRLCVLELCDSLLLEASYTISAAQWQIRLIVGRIRLTHSAKAKDYLRLFELQCRQVRFRVPSAERVVIVRRSVLR